MLPEEYGDEVVQQPVESFQYDGEIVNDPQQGWFGKMRQKLSNLFNEE